MLGVLVLGVLMLGVLMLGVLMLGVLQGATRYRCAQTTAAAVKAA
jgi:hypothetical protein